MLWYLYHRYEWNDSGFHRKHLRESGKKQEIFFFSFTFIPLCIPRSIHMHNCKLEFISVDGCDERPAGSSTIPRSGWAASFPTTIHPYIRSSSSQTAASLTFRGISEIYRRSKCRLHYCEQMGPNTIW